MPISFEINVKGLLAGIQPAVVVSTKGTVKKFPSEGLISLEATPDCLFVNANGGRISVKNPIPYMTDYCTDYKFKEGGTVTIRANDLILILESFAQNEVLTAELFDAEAPKIPDDATDEEKEYFSSLAGTELRLHPVLDHEQVQTLPVLTVPVEVTVQNQKPIKTLQQNRQSLVQAMNMILFAGGYEIRRERFLYWKLHANVGAHRYVAGTGTRFAITNQRGKSISSAVDNMDFLIPVEQSHTVLKVLGDAKAEIVVVKHYGSKISFEAGDLTVVVSGLNPGIKYIDENDVLKRTNLYKFTIAIAEFDMAVRGIEATNSDEVKKRSPVHDVTLSFDADKKVVSLSSSRTTKKAVRKVKLSDAWVSTGNPKTLDFKCNVNFLSEMSKYGKKSEFVQFEFLSPNDPLIANFYASEKVSDGPKVYSNPVSGIEEDFVMLVAKYAD